MVTFGLALVVGEAVRLIWGSDALQVAAPPLLSGVVFLLDEPFPVYRLFLAATGIVVAVAIWQFLERTRLGLLIRATSQNAEMAMRSASTSSSCARACSASAAGWRRSAACWRRRWSPPRTAWRRP